MKIDVTRLARVARDQQLLSSDFKRIIEDTIKDEHVRMLNEYKNKLNETRQAIMRKIDSM